MFWERGWGLSYLTGKKKDTRETKKPQKKGGGGVFLRRSVHLLLGGVGEREGGRGKAEEEPKKDFLSTERERKRPPTNC